MYEPTYDYYYEHIDTTSEAFDDLPNVVKEDLVDWFNCSAPGHEDKKSLLNLYQGNNFISWDCPFCGSRVYKGSPDDWGNFQGTRNQDFSYFGDNDIFTEEFLSSLCNSCRCENCGIKRAYQ